MGKISVVKCENYEDERMLKALEISFENLGGIENFVRPGMNVVLKPNLLMRRSPSEAVTTHPALIKNLAILIQKAGGHVTIAESPGGLYLTLLLKAIYKACGLEKIAKETNLNLNLDLSVVGINNPSGKYLKKLAVIKSLVDADLIINLPKLKSHGQMVFTGAVKNMFGAIPGLLKPEYHLKMPVIADFADALIDVYLSVKPALNIMDAVIGMEGAGPSAGQPRQIGLILAGENAFELDFAALCILGANPLDVPVIKQGVARGLCPENLKTCEIVGEIMEKVRVENFKLPVLQYLQPSLGWLRPKPVFNRHLCTACEACVINCPARVIQLKNGWPQADLHKCVRCFCCQELCPAKAISIKRSILGELFVSLSTWRNRKGWDSNPRYP